MTIRTLIVVGALWLLSLAAVGSITYAQTGQAAAPANMIEATYS